MIEDLMNYLNRSGFSAHLEPANETFDFPEIWINLKDDIILKLHTKSEVIPTQTALVQGSPIHFFHFFIAFDRVMEESLFGEATRLCAILNKVTPLGAFGFSEPDRLFTFSYTFPTSKLDNAAMDVIMSLILYSVELYQPTLLEFKGLNFLTG